MAAAIERRSRYLRDFAHAVSHEFKTPLAGIRGALELVAEHEMAEGDRRRFLTNADADAERLQLLVTRLLELARADMTRVGGEAATSIARVARTVADAAQHETFAVELDLPALPAVAVPAASLERILVTLVEHSRQAGARRAILSASHATVVTLVVRDDGPGIAAADHARIFEPFFTTHRATGGSGLGLAIARSLLDAAGSTIQLIEGSGATFALTLPLARQA